jgi:hypothetical protein
VRTLEWTIDDLVTNQYEPPMIDVHEQEDNTLLLAALTFVFQPKPMKGGKGGDEFDVRARHRYMTPKFSANRYVLLCDWQRKLTTIVGKFNTMRTGLIPSIGDLRRMRRHIVCMAHRDPDQKSACFVSRLDDDVLSHIMTFASTRRPIANVPRNLLFAAQFARVCRQFATTTQTDGCDRALMFLINARLGRTLKSRYQDTGSLTKLVVFVDLATVTCPRGTMWSHAVRDVFAVELGLARRRHIRDIFAIFPRIQADQYVVLAHDVFVGQDVVNTTREMAERYNHCHYYPIKVRDIPAAMTMVPYPDVGEWWSSTFVPMVHGRMCVVSDASKEWRRHVRVCVLESLHERLAATTGTTCSEDSRALIRGLSLASPITMHDLFVALEDSPGTIVREHTRRHRRILEFLRAVGITQTPTFRRRAQILVESGDEMTELAMASCLDPQ